MTRPSRPFPSGPDPYGQGGSPRPHDWDEQQWRRPAGAEPGDERPGEAPQGATEQPYQGPPRAPQVPGAWRPPTVIQPPAARSLPAQDADVLDAAERRARTITHGVGMIAGAILLLVLAVLCGRLIF